MTSSAIRSRRPTARSAALLSVAVVAALGASWSRAQTAEAAAPEAVSATPKAAFERSANPFADHFPNVVLKTHEGRNVRFYDDLLKGKIVLINFMYASCTER